MEVRFSEEDQAHLDLKNRILAECEQQAIQSDAEESSLHEAPKQRSKNSLRKQSSFQRLELSVSQEQVENDDTVVADLETALQTESEIAKPNPPKHDRSSLSPVSDVEDRELERKARRAKVLLAQELEDRKAKQALRDLRLKIRKRKRRHRNHKGVAGRPMRSWSDDEDSDSLHFKPRKRTLTTRIRDKQGRKLKHSANTLPLAMNANATSGQVENHGWSWENLHKRRSSPLRKMADEIVEVFDDQDCASRKPGSKNPKIKLETTFDKPNQVKMMMHSIPAHIVMDEIIDGEIDKPPQAINSKENTRRSLVEDDAIDDEDDHDSMEISTEVNDRGQDKNEKCNDMNGSVRQKIDVEDSLGFFFRQQISSNEGTPRTPRNGIDGMLASGSSMKKPLFGRGKTTRKRKWNFKGGTGASALVELARAKLEQRLSELERWFGHDEEHGDDEEGEEEENGLFAGENPWGKPFFRAVVRDASCVLHLFKLSCHVVKVNSVSNVELKVGDEITLILPRPGLNEPKSSGSIVETCLKSLGHLGEITAAQDLQQALLDVHSPWFVPIHGTVVVPGLVRVLGQHHPIPRSRESPPKSRSEQCSHESARLSSSMKGQPELLVQARKQRPWDDWFETLQQQQMVDIVHAHVECGLVRDMLVDERVGTSWLADVISDPPGSLWSSALLREPALEGQNPSTDRFLELLVPPHLLRDWLEVFLGASNSLLELRNVRFLKFRPVQEVNMKSASIASPAMPGGSVIHWRTLLHQRGTIEMNRFDQPFLPVLCVEGNTLLTQVPGSKMSSFCEFNLTASPSKHEDLIPMESLSNTKTERVSVICKVVHIECDMCFITDASIWSKSPPKVVKVSERRVLWLLQNTARRHDWLVLCDLYNGPDSNYLIADSASMVEAMCFEISIASTRKSSLASNSEPINASSFENEFRSSRYGAQEIMWKRPSTADAADLRDAAESPELWPTRSNSILSTMRGTSIVVPLPLRLSNRDPNLFPSQGLDSVKLNQLSPTLLRSSLHEMALVDLAGTHVRAVGFAVPFTDCKGVLPSHHVFGDGKRWKWKEFGSESERITVKSVLSASSPISFAVRVTITGFQNCLWFVRLPNEYVENILRGVHHSKQDVHLARNVLHDHFRRDSKLKFCPCSLEPNLVLLAEDGCFQPMEQSKGNKCAVYLTGI